MIQLFREYHREFPLHLLHIVAMILTKVRDDGVTVIDAIERVVVDGEDVEAERVVAMSTLLETQVRPVSLVALLTSPATAKELMSTAPIVSA